MKKWIITGIIVIVAIVGTLYAMFFSETADERSDVYAFREFIDKEYTPTFKKIVVHLGESENRIDSGVVGISGWYLLEGGYEENSDLQLELETVKEKIINEEPEYADTFRYKAIIMKQIDLLEDLLQDLATYHSEDGIEAIFNTKLDELTDNIDEMSGILDEHYNQ